MNFRTKVVFTDSFRDLLKKQRYEKIVLRLLNKSDTLIQDIPLIRVGQQSHGECDFVDKVGRKYDVKLLLNQKQGALLGERKNNPSAWFQSMINESIEFSKCIKERKLSLVENTELFSTMRDRIQSINNDEIGILFLPFPIVNDYQSSIFLKDTTDFLQEVYDILNRNGIVSCKGIFFLYPSMENNIIVLREAKTRKREYIKSNELEQYISYDTVFS